MKLTYLVLGLNYCQCTNQKLWVSWCSRPVCAPGSMWEGSLSENSGLGIEEPARMGVTGLLCGISLSHPKLLQEIHSHLPATPTKCSQMLQQIPNAPPFLGCLKSIQTCAVWSARLGRAHPFFPDRWTMLSQKWASVPPVLLPWHSIWEAPGNPGWWWIVSSFPKT